MSITVNPTTYKTYTLAQFLFDCGFSSSAIDGELARYRLVLRGDLSPLRLSPKTRSWAYEHGGL